MIRNFISQNKYISKVYSFLFSRKNQLRILLYHDIDYSNLTNFENQLKELKKKWKFITPHEFELILNGELKINSPSILLTFDDGFYSNRIVAEIFLKRLDIKAIFFVVTDYIEVSKFYHDIFYKKNFFPDQCEVFVPKNIINMNWNDIYWLLENGHEIGFHTKSHKKLSTLNQKELINQIDIGLKKIELKIGRKINHFAFPFGDINSINDMSFNYIKTRFKYIHTGIRGDNSNNKFTQCILREAVQPSDTIFLLNSILSGLFDFKYFLHIKKYIKYLK